MPAVVCLSFRLCVQGAFAQTHLEFAHVLKAEEAQMVYYLLQQYTFSVIHSLRNKTLTLGTLLMLMALAQTAILIREICYEMVRELDSNA